MDTRPHILALGTFLVLGEDSKRIAIDPFRPEIERVEPFDAVDIDEADAGRLILNMGNGAVGHQSQPRLTLDRALRHKDAARLGVEQQTGARLGRDVLRTRLALRIEGREATGARRHQDRDREIVAVRLAEFDYCHFGQGGRSGHLGHGRRRKVVGRNQGERLAGLGTHGHDSLIMPAGRSA